MPKPFIAAINGPCAGLGFVIALYADIRFASDAAVFTTSFSRRGLIAEHGVSWLLPRLVGIGRAADLLYSSRRVSAVEAAAMGLVNRVIPLDSFHAEVAAYARMLANEVSPRSLREMKREIWNAQFQTLGQAIESADADMGASFVRRFQGGRRPFHREARGSVYRPLGRELCDSVKSSRDEAGPALRARILFTANFPAFRPCAQRKVAGIYSNLTRSYRPLKTLSNT